MIDIFSLECLAVTAAPYVPNPGTPSDVTGDILFSTDSFSSDGFTDGFLG